MSSLVSTNGPSTTVFFPPEKRTRLPLRLGWRPSMASITPALTSSSLTLPMSARSFSLGMTPASEVLVAFTITMTRIGCSFRSGRTPAPNGRASPSVGETTNAAGPDRHVPVAGLGSAAEAPSNQWVAASGRPHPEPIARGEPARRPQAGPSGQGVEHPLHVLVLLQRVHQRQHLLGTVLGERHRTLGDVLRLGGDQRQLAGLDGRLELAEALEGAADHDLLLALLAGPLPHLLQAVIDEIELQRLEVQPLRGEAEHPHLLELEGHAAGGADRKSVV